MKRNVSRFKKISRIRRLMQFFLLVFFIIFLSAVIHREPKIRNNNKKRKISKNLEENERKPCSHRHHEITEEVNEEDLHRLLMEWECDYCGKIFNGKGIPNDQPFWPTLKPLIEKHLRECEKGREIIDPIDAKKDNNLIYDNEEILKEKGYHGSEIKDWELTKRIILPDLKEEKRKGAVKSLSVNITINKKNKNKKIWEALSSKSVFGQASDLVILLTPRATPITRQNFSELLKKKKPDFFYSHHAKEELKIYERILTNFFARRILQKGDKWGYNTYVLEVDKDKHIAAKFKKTMGESGTLSFYLALLSAYYQKPISKEVAAAGFLNIGDYSQFNHCPWCFEEEVVKNPQKNLTKHRIDSVGGLEHKIPAAVDVGVKKLILSTEQKEDYEKNIPEEIKKQLKVYYVKNVEELEELFFRGEFS